MALTGRWFLPGGLGRGDDSSDNEQSEQTEEDDEIEVEAPAGLEIPYDDHGGVVNSGFKRGEWREELGARRDATDELSRDIERHEDQYRKKLRQAQSAEGTRKLNYWGKAKSEKIQASVKNRIRGRLMRELFLMMRLDLIQYAEDIHKSASYSFDVDFNELPIRDMVDEISSMGDRNWMAEENLKELERALGEEFEMVDGPGFEDIQSDMRDLGLWDDFDIEWEDGEEFEEAVDDRIRQELHGGAPDGFEADS